MATSISRISLDQIKKNSDDLGQTLAHTHTQFVILTKCQDRSSQPIFPRLRYLQNSSENVETSIVDLILAGPKNIKEKDKKYKKVSENEEKKKFEKSQQRRRFRIIHIFRIILVDFSESGS